MQNICLRHEHPGSDGNEHERPRVLENEISREEIQAKTDLIRKLHASGVQTTEIHKTLQTIGKRLGHMGKQVVSGRGY